MNYPELSKINDIDFASERSSRPPIYAVGFADRTRPGYRKFVRSLDALAHAFTFRGVSVRLIHVDEHPILARQLALGAFPTLIVYSFGEALARWAGRIDGQAPRRLLEALIAANKDDPRT